MFVTTGNLSTHIKTVHETSEDFSGDKCRKVFKIDGELRVHIKTVHMSSQEFSCDKCNKSFGIDNDLSAHVKAAYRKLILVLYCLNLDSNDRCDWEVSSKYKYQLKLICNF